MKNRINENCWLINRPAAHRGLHGNGIAENSKTAFLLAIENNYPIETDIQETSDGKIVIFHDDNLKRMTGLDKKIWDTEFSEVRKLKLADTEDGIMTFQEFLALVDGKVPLLIEIKSQSKKGIVKKVIDTLENYKGEYAIQSFDARQMLEVKKLRPDVIRGQLATRNRAKYLPWYKNFVLTKMPFNPILKPDFINMEENCLDFSESFRKKYAILCWTVRSEEERKLIEGKTDSYVFENIRP